MCAKEVHKPTDIEKMSIIDGLPAIDDEKIPNTLKKFFKFE